MSKHNVVVVMDAFKRWNVEDFGYVSSIETEARAFGSYISTMLPYVRMHAEVVHFVDYVHFEKHGLMDEIDRKNDRIIHRLSDIWHHPDYFDHFKKHLDIIYFCGFHYDRCVYNAYKNMNLKGKVGGIFNLSLPYNTTTYKSISKMKMQQYMFSPWGGFEKIKELSYE